MANIWDTFADSLRAAHGSGSTKSAQELYEAAVKAGRLEPGKKGSYALPSDFSIPNNRRPLTDEEIVLRGRPALLGLSPAEAIDLNRRSMEDPTHYISRMTPERYFESIYGDQWQTVKNAAMQSQRAGDGHLDGHPIMRYVTPGDTQDLLSRRAFVVKGPGIAYVEFDPKTGKQIRTMHGFANKLGGMERTIFIPRINHQYFGTFGHEVRHLLDSRIDSASAAAPFFNNPDVVDSYNNRAVEMKANAGLVKANHFQLTGNIIRNAGDAKKFVESLKQGILTDDPAPIARFGASARVGKPIPGYGLYNGFLKKLIEKSPGEEQKLQALLPKVFSVAAPVAAAAAAGDSER